VNLNNLDANEGVKRFHNSKTEWGFTQLLSHDILNDSSNGYLVDDTCVFGVEVLFIKGIRKGESLSMISEPQRNYFTWKIDNYTALKDKVYFSEQFTVKVEHGMIEVLLFYINLNLQYYLLLYNLYLCILDIGS
jgi:hypothetical protein